MDHRQPNTALIMNQLAAQRIREADDRMLGRAIGGLQRNTAIREGRSYLHDGSAIARQHSPQCRERPVHHAQVGDFCDSLVFFCRHFPDRGKDGSHRIINPDVDGAKTFLDMSSCLLNCPAIGNVRGNDSGFSTRTLNFPLGGIESIDSASQKSNLGAVTAKLPRDCAAETSRGAGYNYRFSFQDIFYCTPFVGLRLAADALNHLAHLVR